MSGSGSGSSPCSSSAVPIQVSALSQGEMMILGISSELLAASVLIITCTGVSSNKGFPSPRYRSLRSTSSRMS